MATGTGDIVLAHIDGNPAFFARIETISPDVKRGWWQVKLLVLTVPVQVYTWILEESQINGEPYTMGGVPVRLEKIVSPVAADEPPPEKPVQEQHDEKGKVVSLFGRKKETD
jgi:hypothetical protein